MGQPGALILKGSLDPLRPLKIISISLRFSFRVLVPRWTAKIHPEQFADVRWHHGCLSEDF